MNRIIIVWVTAIGISVAASPGQAALPDAIQKYADRSHAERNFGRFLCVDWQDLGDFYEMMGPWLVRANTSPASSGMRSVSVAHEAV